jgi:SAM-dependent methyltransferase
LYVPIKSCETNYSDELIELILKTKGIDYLCDEICREIDPNYVQRDLQFDLSSYLPDEDFANQRILDFGCGSGASTMILSRMYPKAEIVGVELEEKHLKIARARLQHYQNPNVNFEVSPSPNELPKNIGSFDLIIFSAVYEHLLPNERKDVLPLIWSVLKPSGLLFLNMTPHRWFPIEHHTTNLPLINYLPKSLALPFARRFSNRIDKTEPWEVLLRRGIRGATEFEILKNLNQSSANKAKLLNPKIHKDRIDLWFAGLNQERHLIVKKGIRTLMKTIRLISGTTLVQNLSLLIQKSER